MVKEKMNVEVLDHGEKDTFEYCVSRLYMKTKSLIIVGIYHPPAALRKTNQQFIREFLEFTSALITIHKNAIFLGDFITLVILLTQMVRIFGTC